MTIIHERATLLHFIYKQKAKGLTIGFVPTMGALHQGHIDLVNQSAGKSDITVCSIFVNPTQFNDPADFRKYPNRLENDIHLLSQSGASVLFLPSVETMYPDGTTALEHYELGYLETILEGKYRPGHFQGVCQVMSRLLDAVRPHLLFMGQKDYQQCMVVSKLIELLKSDVKLVTCATVRENDGLAMSSRNLRLNENERLKAAVIYQTLRFIASNISEGDTGKLKEEAQMMLGQEGFKVDYVEVATAKELEPVNYWDGRQKLVALIAAFLGDVRLIDNMLI